MSQVIGIDLGGSKIALGLVDQRDEIARTQASASKLEEDAPISGAAWLARQRLMDQA